MASTTANEIPSATPIEVSFPLPKAQQTSIHLQLTNNHSSLLIFLTTASSDSGASVPLGSFVYAMPNPSSPTQPLSTALYTVGATLDFTTRIAKVLARKTGKPVYVGNSISFASTGMGGTVEEEMEAFRRCVEVVSGLLERAKDGEKQDTET
ncbi:hypothetical protein P154DRAFT_321602 [Amniculicola lignicola CBS 123094]|uniref:Proteasome assembly chaperone 3 n=1 Tax=Amniculicola lignicola CBS 123094 TaxID=1392246 RepID=A0A6A5W8D3_9PLEO|nr:hypothetical protein P154DRAFT_321602 [Amniculicola lignicola CBS 123094]